MPTLPTKARFTIAVCFAATALFLASVNHDAIALLSLGVAIYLLGREAILPVWQLVYAVLLCSLGTLVHWAPYRLFGNVSLASFLVQNWPAPAFWFVTYLWFIWRFHSSADETWQILKSQYSTDFEPSDSSDTYLGVSGFLSFEDEAFPISTVVTASGIVLLRSPGNLAHIPWATIESITRTNSGQRSVATLALKRQIPLPFKIDVPWSVQFDDRIPGKFVHAA